MKPFDRIRAGLLIALPVLILWPVSGQTTSIPSPEDLLNTNLQRGRPIQALYQIEALATQNGWTADWANRAGNLWAALGNPNRAVTYWEMATRLSPPDITLTRTLAQAYLDMQRWSEATIALNQVLEIAPEDQWAHYHLGILQVAFAQESAAEHLEIARQNPIYQTTVDALLSIQTSIPAERAVQVGIVLIDHDLWGIAEMVFQYAADIADPFPTALAYVGLARDYQGKSGREQIEQALALAPQSGQVLYLYGLHLRLMNDESSLQAFQQAVELDPLNPAYAAELGAAYQQIGNLGLAEYWFREAVTFSGNDARFHALLDQFYSQIPTIGN
ncbi:MAG: hypothetical protein K8L97_17315 [Anaerolineae bacterium]|nr:hypothetical protein [Anaerolineae bacterium]